MNDNQIAFVLEKHEAFIISTALTALIAQIKEKGIEVPDFESAMIYSLINRFNESLV